MEVDKSQIVNSNDVSMTGLDTSRAISNKWIGYVPLQNALGTKFRNLELNLTRFSIPQMTMGTSTTSFKGIDYDYPTHVMNPSSREITFDYKVSQDWVNYKSLYIWASAFAVLNPVDAEALKAQTMGESVVAATGVDPASVVPYNDLLDCRVWLLDNYKRRVIDFTFYNCFIKDFSEVTLDYSSTDEIVHSFTMAYTHYTIDSVGVTNS